MRNKASHQKGRRRAIILNFASGSSLCSAFFEKEKGCDNNEKEMKDTSCPSLRDVSSSPDNE